MRFKTSYKPTHTAPTTPATHRHHLIAHTAAPSTATPTTGGTGNELYSPSKQGVLVYDELVAI